MSHATNPTEPPLRSPLSDTSADSTMFSHKHPVSQPTSGDRFSAESDSSDRSFLRFHQHNSSAGSTAFCSYESSPTTTYSTLDDSSATEPSPDSSPESPPPASFTIGMDDRPQTADDEKRSAFFDLQRLSPPAKKGRNLKNLAVNTSRNTGHTPSLTGLPIGLQRQESAPSVLSPAFVKPPEPQKRRPSTLGLTILTPSTINTSPKQIRLAIPPTPGFNKPPKLRHFQSSPSLPLINGLVNKAIVDVNGATRGPLDTIFSPLDTSIVHPIKEAGQDDDHNYDIPLSREEQPEAYPDGPICVYPPYIDLYLEPTAEQARQYDVVLNVASEVLNPFDAQSTANDVPETQLRLDGGGGIQYAPARQTVTPSVEEEHANGSPTTPKAGSQTSDSLDTTPTDTQKTPEYIHIPWEHNSDIVPDLLRLVKLMDEKIREKKRVLVHCQCGVSRSASLVVAYGLYKEPSMSVQEAYDAVKQRSKWIGPNMNLIMQLQEFRSSLARGGVLSNNRGLSPITPTSALSDWAGPFSARANDVGPHSDSLSVRYPAPPTSRSEHFDQSVKSPLVTSTEPWSAALPTRRSRAISGVRTSAYVDPAGHVLPVVSIIEAPTAITGQFQTESHVEASVQSPSEPEKTPDPTTAADFAMAPLTPPKAVEPADHFGLMSPTTTELTSNPFDRAALLAQMGMTTHATQHSVPTRSRSLKSHRPTKDQSGSETGLSAPKRLRGKISSPTLREQHQLQHMQAQLEAQLPRRQPVAAEVSGLDSALLSPRATSFTQNPFALAFDTPALTGDINVVVDATPAVDPRSPAQKGTSPIIRNIEHFL